MDTHVEASKSSNKTWVFVLGCFLGLSCLLVLGLLGCFGSLAWAVNQEIANSTATAQQEAVIKTATAEVRATEISASGLFDRFDSNKNGWKIGTIDTDWVGKIEIANGMYIWNVEELKQGFLTYSYTINSPVATDFDVAVDTKIDQGDYGACTGILFRTSPYGWDYGDGYAFSVCKEGQFFTGYVSEEGKWINTSGWMTSPAIKLNDWNHIEVNARGAHFILKINDVIVYEMDDSSRADGKVALFVEIHEITNDTQGLLNNQGAAMIKAVATSPHSIPVTFLFDNFSFLNK